MKRFGLLATVVALTAVFSTSYSGLATATPVKLAFKGTVIEPIFGARDEPVYTTGGGVFAPGQSVTGTLIYGLESSFPPGVSGNRATYLGVFGSFAFSVATSAGLFESQLDFGLVQACKGTPPDCSLLGPEDLYSLIALPGDPAVQPMVNGQSLTSGQILFLGADLLASTALLSVPELLSVFGKASKNLFALGFEGSTCNPVCGAWARVDSLSVVPEPATVGLVLVGLAAMARRKKRS